MHVYIMIVLKLIFISVTNDIMHVYSQCTITIESAVGGAGRAAYIIILLLAS